MVYFILFLIVGLVFAFLYNNYDTNQYKINVNKKIILKGDIIEHEAGLLVALIAKVAKADGVVSELEAELISNTLTEISSKFENSDEVRAELKKIYEEEKKDFKNLPIICEKYIKLVNYETALRTIEFLINLAFIDKDFASSERMIIEDIAKFLGINQKDLELIINKFETYYQNFDNSLSLEKALEIFNLPKDTNLKEIKKQYRKLVKENHPDIIIARGGDEKDIAKANQKLQEINEAYELLKKHFN